MPVRLIALDIDGTLLNSRWEVSAENRAAIAEATARGIEVALVTGRRYDFAMPVAQQIESPVTMIVNNGALVRTPDGVTHVRHVLATDTARSVLEMTRAWREGTAVIFDRPVKDQVMLESIDLEDTIRGGYYARNLEFLGQVSPLEECLTEAPLQIMFTGRVSPMRAVEALISNSELSDDVALAVTVYDDKDFAMVDVIHPGITKGKTLAEWSALRGIAREEILALGDNHNDFEMLSFAGIPVVMGNCVAELKTYGWHETHSNDDDGVAKAIRKFALEESSL